MDWKKFTGPAVLFGLVIILYLGIQAYGDVKYDEGDTVESGDMMGICGAYLLMVLSCLGSIVWFAFALGTKTRKTVFLTQAPSNSEHTPSLLAKHVQSTGVHSTIGGGHLSNVREKIIIARSEGDTAQILGFLIIAGSAMMFVFMIISGFIWALSQMGPGLGGSGGSCGDTCEAWGSAAEFSMWASLFLFPCGLIALARPWSWFSSDQDIHDPVVKVRIGIVAVIALIAVISFGWPALLVLAIALVAFAATGWMNK